VQPLLSSSYAGYGISSIDRDADELVHLMRALRARGCRSCVLVGHSSGCQGAVRTVARLRDERVRLGGAAAADAELCRVAGVVLQAPVSDRESQEWPMLARATALVAEGRGGALMPIEADSNLPGGVPITAQRYFDLGSVGGCDDMFSSDLTGRQLRERLGHVGEAAPSLLLLSAEDEYVPPHVDARALARRLGEGVGGQCDARVVAGADHAATGAAPREEVVRTVVAFARRTLLDGPRASGGSARALPPPPRQQAEQATAAPRAAADDGDGDGIAGADLSFAFVREDGGVSDASPPQAAPPPPPQGAPPPPPALGALDGDLASRIARFL